MTDAFKEREKALEDEYFRRQEQEALAKVRAQIAMEGAPKCPRDGSPLSKVEFEGASIERCNDCKGVWLDGGELEHLMSRQPADSDNWFTRFWNGER